jgi:hypothetical protein
MDDPLFRSANGALMFALNYTHGGLKRPAITAMMVQTPGRKGKGLGGLDGAAQAGMIQCELGGLSTLRAALLVGRYAVPTAPCSCRSVCCRGWRENPDWKDAVDWLTEYVLRAGLTGNISHHRFRRALVSRHFGVKDSFITIAAEARVDRNTASRQYRSVHDHLKEQERIARTEIDGMLSARGVVGDAL